MAKNGKDRKRMTQKELAEFTGIQPAVISRDWKPRFEEHGWPGFYDDGVDSIEFLRGRDRWNDLKREKTVRLDGDPDDRLKEQRSEKLQIEIQGLRGEMIYIPDFVDEIERMQAEYVNASSRVPRTASAALLAFIAETIAEDIATYPEVAAAFEKIRQCDIEIWMDKKFSIATGDMGKRLNKAWKDAIARSRMRFS